MCLLLDFYPSSMPYLIISFYSISKTLWLGLNTHIFELGPKHCYDKGNEVFIKSRPLVCD